MRGKTSGGPGLEWAAGGGSTGAAGFAAAGSTDELLFSVSAGRVAGATGISKANSGGAGAGAEAGGGIFCAALVTANQRRPASMVSTNAEPKRIDRTTLTPLALLRTAVDVCEEADNAAVAKVAGRTARATGGMAGCGSSAADAGV